MDHRKWFAWSGVTVGVFVAVTFLCLLGTSHPVEGLRCRTGDGPSTDDVKKIVRTCVSKITNAGSENRSSDEYPDYNSSDPDDSSEEQKEEDDRKDSNSRRGSVTNKNYLDQRQDGSGRGNGRPTWSEEGSRRRPMDPRDHRNGPRMGDRGRDRNDEEQQMMRDYGRQYNRRKRQYYGGPGSPSGSGDQSNYGRVSELGNGTRNGNASSLERDRACLMQCFFEELKATNAEGFPEKHKVLHVITKDIRDHELREFYVDSIQECFHMLGMDNRLKDKCDYSMRFVTCLSDRFQSNCDDWDSVSSAMF